MPDHPGVSSRRRLIALLPLLLLTGLVALQIQQGFVRVGVLRDRQRSQFLNAVERMNSEVASAVAGDIERGLERAATLAEILGQLEWQEQVPGAVLSQALERYQASHEDCVGAFLEPLGAPGVRGSAVEWDSDQGVLAFRSPLASGPSGGEPTQEVHLRFRAGPLLARVTRFQPIEGVGNVLIDPFGRVVALDRAARPLGLEVGQDLSGRFDRQVLTQVLQEKARVRAQAARLFVSPLGVERPLFLLVSVVPDTALLAKAEPARHEARLVVLVSLLSTSGLVLAGFLFHRANLRERSLRQRSRELERDRQLAERMATSERLSALGLLTAGVAHEINNPLEGIRNYLSLLGEEGLSAPDRTRYLERVEHGLERIRVIVRDLLGFARPRAQSGTFDLRVAVRSGLDLARLAPDLKGCRVKLGGELADSMQAGGQGPGPGPDAAVRGDAGGIGQVVLNLLLNAGRAARREVSVSLTRGGGDLVLRIEDDGAGIASEDLPHIFDPFFTRAASASGRESRENQKASGTGLGLTISYSIVESHGGTLSASNRPGGGACFEVRLPLAQDASDEENTRGGERP